MRRKVPPVVSPGSSVAAKKPCSAISRLGGGTLRLLPVAHDEQGDVIGGEGVEMRIDAEQLRRGGQLHPDFLLQLAGERLGDRLVLLDAAARHVPTRPIAVPHQQHALLRIQHHALCAHGQAA